MERWEDGIRYVLDVVAVRHVLGRRHGTVDCLDIVHEDKDTACEDKDESDDTQATDGVQAEEVI